MVIDLAISSVLHIMVPVSGKNLARDQWDVDEGTSIAGVLGLLDLTGVPTLLILNGQLVGDESILKEGDTLKVFPLVSGG